MAYLDFYHTFVPNALRGKGLAAVITQAALDYAQAHGYRVVAGCSYVETYMRRQAGRS